MRNKQVNVIRNGRGFIAALDQSGGSTPQALQRYGISQDMYSNKEEMFDLIHEMRKRIITSPSFSSDHILGSILFEQTMDRTIDGIPTGEYLWEKKGIVPFLKVDQGLDALNDGVQLMKPITELQALLKRAREKLIFGTKMRSVIKGADRNGIKKLTDQQFEYGEQIAEYGLIPIIEPEVDILCPDKEECEKILIDQIMTHLDALSDSVSIMLKLTIPSIDGFFSELAAHPRVMRVLALSGGYSRKEANEKLTKNPGLIASFSRALTEGLNSGQSDDEFNAALSQSIISIYNASIA